MKIIGLQWALPAAVLASVFSAAGHAEGANSADHSRQGVQAKLEYCETCHGPSGEGYHGYFTMPRLAGEQPRYIENQIRAFVERRRTNQVMSDVARSLRPSTVALLANHFHGLHPGPARDGPRRLVASGKTVLQGRNT